MNINWMKYIVWISALSIALCAAFFSVTGIATLFSGKFWAVMAMASALEVGKLVAASFLYRYWKGTPGILKSYLVASVVVLMFITSIGIYGYLSAAYAEVAAIPQNTMNQITAIESRQTTLDDNISRWTGDNQTLENRRAQAQTSLDNILTGETDLSQRSAFGNLRTEIEELDNERRTNNESIAAAQAERDSLENIKVQHNAALNTNSEVGTFIYIARTLGLPLDTVVKWFVLVIVFVFDPLAISLILAYNNLVMREEKENPKPKKTRPFSELKEQMPEESQERIEERVQAMMASLPEPPPPEPAKVVPRNTVARVVAREEDEGIVDADERYRDVPYYKRAGYDWNHRKIEWQKDAEAVKYYEEHVKTES